MMYIFETEDGMETFISKFRDGKGLPNLQKLKYMGTLTVQELQFFNKNQNMPEELAGLMGNQMEKIINEIEINDYYQF